MYQSHSIDIQYVAYLHDCADFNKIFISNIGFKKYNRKGKLICSFIWLQTLQGEKLNAQKKRVVKIIMIGLRFL